MKGVTRMFRDVDTNVGRHCIKRLLSFSQAFFVVAVVAGLVGLAGKFDGFTDCVSILRA